MPIAAALLTAVCERKLSPTFAEKPPSGHISSIGVITLLRFVIAGLGVWSASRRETAQFSQGAGLNVAAALIVAFAAVALGPTSEWVNKVRDAASGAIERWIGGFSKSFSAFDGVLVFATAPVMGVDQPKRLVLYGMLFGHLILIGTLGWQLPAPWGLLPRAFSIVAVVAIAGRWAWVEADRENPTLNRKYSGAQIRICFSNDLRDEALLGFMSLFVIVPRVLRQRHLADGGALFVISPEASVNDVLPWVRFFGGELAKATRVIVDLVFPAARLQALSSLQRSAKLKDMFYKDRTSDRLDPFANDSAFHQLAVAEDGGWRLVDDVPEPFWAYDKDRMEELAQRSDDGAISFVARAILERNAKRPPEQCLADEARHAKPDSRRLDFLVTRVRDERSVPLIEPLKLAYLHLNSNGKALGVRLQIVQIVGGSWSTTCAVGCFAPSCCPARRATRARKCDSRRFNRCCKLRCRATTKRRSGLFAGRRRPETMQRQRCSTLRLRW